MGPVTLILALAGIIWIAVIARQARQRVPAITPVVFGAASFLVVASVFGADFFSIETHPIPVTIDRVMLVGLIVLFFVQVLLGYERIRQFTRTDIIVLSLALFIMHSTFSYDWRYLDNLPISRLLFFNLFPFVIYFVVRNARLQLNEMKFITILLGMFSIYLAFTAIAEIKEFSWAVFPRYIANPDYEEFFGRARGPFMNPVTNGIFMTVGFAGLLTWWPRLNKAGKLGITLLAPVIVMGIYSTLTRSVWLSFGLSAAIVLLIVVPRRLRGGLVVCGLLAGLVVGAVFAEQMKSFKRDKFVTEAEMRQSASLRPLFAVIAVRMFKDRPIVGCGFGQYSAAKKSYLRDPTGKHQLMLTKSLMQHNLFLSYVTELGLVGLGLLLMLLLNLLAMAMAIWRNRRRYLLARQFGLLMIIILIIHVTNGMFHDVSIAPMANMLLYFFAGLTTNLFTAKGLTEMSNEDIKAGQTVHVVPAKTTDRLTELSS